MSDNAPESGFCEGCGRRTVEYYLDRRGVHFKCHSCSGTWRPSEQYRRKISVDSRTLGGLPESAGERALDR